MTRFLCFAAICFCLPVFVSAQESANPVSTVPVFHIDELRKEQDPYSSIQNPNFEWDFSWQSSVLRDVTFKPLEEHFDYWDVNLNTWVFYKRGFNSYSLNGNLDTFHQLLFDQPLQEWHDWEKIIYTYDGNNQLSTDLIQEYDWQQGSLVNYLKNEFSYDAFGNNIKEEISFWDPSLSQWYYDHKHELDYNNFSQETLIHHFYWDILTSGWLQNEQYASAYDSAGNKISYVGLVYDIASGTWKNQGKDTLLYDNENQLILYESNTWLEASSTWQPLYSNTYEYDNGNLIKSTQKTWNANSGSLVNNFQSLWEFSPDNLLTIQITQNWNAATGSWDNYFKTGYYYDAGEFLVKEVDSTWTGSSWVATYQYLYTNDQDGNVLESIGQSWSNTLMEWVNVEKYTAIWEQFATGVQEHSTDLPSPIFYPNPARDKIFILPFGEPVSVIIEDAEGQLRHGIQVTNECINVSCLKNGIYFLKLMDGRQQIVAVSKLIIAR